MCHEQRRQTHRIASLGGERRVSWNEAREAIDASAALLKIHVIGPRSRLVRRAGVAVRFPDHHQPVEIGKRHRAKQHRVDHAEDRRGHAHPERQREDGGRGEARIPAEQAGGVAEILEQHAL